MFLNFFVIELNYHLQKKSISSSKNVIKQFVMYIWSPCGKRESSRLPFILDQKPNIVDAKV